MIVKGNSAWLKMTKLGKCLIIFGLTFGFLFVVSAQENQSPQQAASSQAQPQTEITVTVQKEPRPLQAQEVLPVPGKPLEQSQDQETSVISQNVTLDFKDADITNVLKIISLKSGVNIVATPDVIGNVTIRLFDVPWEMALDVILKTYGYGYERQGNVILVAKMENISKLQADEPLKTEIINLKFLDAQDAQKILIPLLSSRGRISILYTRGQKGWKFGTFKIGRETTGEALQKEATSEQSISEPIAIQKTATGLVSEKAEFQPSVKSKVLIVTDTASSIDRIVNLILPQIDKKPKQVLIETRIMEVNIDTLRDIGFDWGTGTSGASGYTTPPTDLPLSSRNRSSLAGRNLGSEFTPSAFSPLESLTNFTGAYPYSAGLELLYKKLTGDQFEIIIHALEEDAHTNTLSAPKVLTLDNQEASILVGFHTPILTSTVTAGSTTSGTGATITQTLDYYQEIGIRLNVVPQVNDEGYINMIIHPSITSSTSNVNATSTASGSTTTTSYPIIDVRETQTQILLKDGETVVIGGLLKDVKSKETIGVPFVSKIPIFGKLFQREINDVEKVDLLMFISARIIKEGEFTSEQITKLEERLTTIHHDISNPKKKKK